MKYREGKVNDVEIVWKGWGRYRMTLGNRETVEGFFTPTVRPLRYTRQELVHLLAHLKHELSQSLPVVSFTCSNMLLTLPLDAALRIEKKLNLALRQVDSGTTDRSN